MKPVVQLERTGCGIASVATVAGVSYQAARKTAARMGIFAEDQRLWSEPTYVRRLLKQYHIQVSPGERPFVSWSALPDRALLAIKWHRKNGRAYWHWVVFVRDPQRTCILDSRHSLKRHVRMDFHRMKPKWFIQMTKASGTTA